jgi:hypothetical protein
LEEMPSFELQMCCESAGILAEAERSSIALALCPSLEIV